MTLYKNTKKETDSTELEPSPKAQVFRCFGHFVNLG